MGEKTMNEVNQFQNIIRHSQIISMHKLILFLAFLGVAIAAPTFSLSRLFAPAKSYTLVKPDLKALFHPKPPSEDTEGNAEGFYIRDVPTAVSHHSSSIVHHQKPVFTPEVNTYYSAPLIETLDNYQTGSLENQYGSYAHLTHF